MKPSGTAEALLEAKELTPRPGPCSEGQEGARTLQELVMDSSSRSTDGRAGATLVPPGVCCSEVTSSPAAGTSQLCAPTACSGKRHDGSTPKDMGEM